jgi:SAM-dependent methyltransferase
MPWTFVRPRDPLVLKRRPLLDIGVGDGQTLRSLAKQEGLLVGVDRSREALRAARMSVRLLVCSEARSLPFDNATFSTVLAGDVFHHLDDEHLVAVLSEIARVTRAGGILVAWWYEAEGRPAVDTPRYPRRFEEMSLLVETAGLHARELPLEVAAGTPTTVGLVASPAVRSASRR